MRPGSERLAPADEANVVLDHPGQVNAFLVAALLGSGGFVDADGAPDLAVLRATLARRVDALPALRRVLVADGRHHAWIESSPDLHHHVRLTDAPEGPGGLEQLCAQLMTVPLDRRRPLWEVQVVPRARGQQSALVLRVHHAIADGVTAVAIVRSLFDEMSGVDARRGASPRHPATAVTHRSALSRFGYGLKRVRATLGAREVGSTVLLGARSDRRGVVFVAIRSASCSCVSRSVGSTPTSASA